MNAVLSVNLGLICECSLTISDNGTSFGGHDGGCSDRLISGIPERLLVSTPLPARARFEVSKHSPQKSGSTGFPSRAQVQHSMRDFLSPGLCTTISFVCRRLPS